jgi:hypothetical protein
MTAASSEPELQHALAGAVAAHFSGRGMHSQVFAGELVARAIVERDFKNPGTLMEQDVGGGMGCHGAGAYRI